MWKAVLAACALSVAALPAAAGDWRHHHHYRVVKVVQAPHVPWYHQHPWLGTGPGYYYSHHPDHIPAYPKPLTGYPVPIYDTTWPVVQVVQGVRPHGVSAHVGWCAARYRSYDARSDSFQPLHGPRRACHSPYR